MIWKYLIGLLTLVAVTVWMAVFAYPDPEMKIIACDVGQGDAILATYGTKQILIDGGPGDKVLSCLDKHIPFWDREIDVVVLTHPQSDHFNGLIEVMSRYEVDKFVATAADSSSQGYQVLKKIVGGGGSEVVNPTTGMVIRLGKIHLDILHPSEQFVLNNSKGFPSEQLGHNVLGAFDVKGDINDYSVVVSLSLGEFDALLTGDIGPEISDVISEQIKASGKDGYEYIKIPHHGSKNGLSEKLLIESDPEVAVITVGSNNRYGHPHSEILKLLGDYEIETLRTDIDGEIVITTNGKSWQQVK